MCIENLNNQFKDSDKKRRGTNKPRLFISSAQIDLRLERSEKLSPIAHQEQSITSLLYSDLNSNYAEKH